ncbi:MAG: ribosomal protein S12 methylthiotransferase RimO [Deltaproteobacteria bacterium RBG_13_52_11]|nr:MAG: ribosomal protein S12 methylthiotransferase RimO [Deltaproteobacteria bacterium RBG_13_52_11]
MTKVFLVSLGCPKNHVDSEVLLGILANDGLVLTSTLDEADVVIINTCAFIQEAVQESIEAILEAARAKGQGAINTLIVTGCLPQRYGEELVQSIPEVDLWTGTGDFLQIPQWLKKGGPRKLIGKPRYLYDHHTPRIITNTPHSAYVKIAEGCSHPCTFCLIPRLRGRYRSRELGSVIRETENLVARGVVEVTLVAQDTTAYGTDRGEEKGLYRLLKTLTKIEGLKWIRVLYSYPHPANFPPQLLDMVAGEERICPYLDIPIQHVDDTLLRRMGRRVSEKGIRRLVYRLKRAYPEIHLRTTLMVGFPGEGEREFRKLLDFVREVEFTHLGVFRYSPEEGTKASRMKGQIFSEIAEERAAQIMELQQGISWKRNKEMVGSIIPVLIDGVSVQPKGVPQGRTAFQAPEVDGVVHIKKGMAKIGETVTVKITQAGPYDLVGEIEERS